MMAAKLLADHYDYGFLNAFNEKIIASLVIKHWFDGSFNSNMVKTIMAIQTMDAIGDVEGVVVNEKFETRKTLPITYIGPSDTDDEN